MKVTTVEQLNSLESVIGQENVEAGKKLLADNGEMWVFQSLEELEKDQELKKEEKEWCRRERFAQGETWAGWFRPPQKPQPYFPGFSIHPDYDTHGNYRPSHSSTKDKWSH